MVEVVRFGSRVQDFGARVFGLGLRVFLLLGVWGFSFNFVVPAKFLAPGSSQGHFPKDPNPLKPTTRNAESQTPKPPI